MDYLEFLRASSQKCVWWWAVGVAVTSASAFIAVIGFTPQTVRHYWYWWVIASLVIMFFGVNAGAWKLLNERERAFNVRVAELKSEREKQQNQERAEAKQKRFDALKMCMYELLKSNEASEITEDAFARQCQASVEEVKSVLLKLEDEGRAYPFGVNAWRHGRRPNPPSRFSR